MSVELRSAPATWGSASVDRGLAETFVAPPLKSTQDESQQLGQNKCVIRQARNLIPYGAETVAQQLAILAGNLCAPTTMRAAPHATPAPTPFQDPGGSSDAARTGRLK